MNVRFARARFLSDTTFDGAHCAQDAKFAKAIFERSRAFQGFSAGGDVDLDGAVFADARGSSFARRASMRGGRHFQRECTSR